MDEMPGMIRPDLQALPQVKDRMTFLYLEHCTLGRQDGAITVTDEKGVVSSPAAGISVLLWGIGASLGFPLTISAASDTGPDAPKRVSVVAITGYLAFLVGPPLLGFLGEHFGLRSAMMVVLGLVMVAALVARAVAKPQSEPVMENS